MKKIFIMLFFASLTCSAFADQCQLVDGADQKYVWKSAQALLKNAKEFVSYCGKCDDDLSKVKIERVISSGKYTLKDDPFLEQYRGVQINNKNVDMAYIYIRTGSRVFTNLALLVGCPADTFPVMYTAPGKRAAPVSWEELSSGTRVPASVEMKK